MNVPSVTDEERTEKEYFICRQAPGASGDAGKLPGEASLTSSVFKLRGKVAFGRDSEAWSGSDSEHYA
jgi:hypothetical protein